MSTEEINMLCVGVAKDALEVITYVDRNDSEGVNLQFEQITAKIQKLKNLLVLP